MLLRTNSCFLLVLIALISLGGCAVNPGYETPEEALLLDGLTQDVETGDPEEILNLPADVVQQIEAVVEEDWSQIRKFRALRRYLFDDDKLNIQYDARSTSTAAETFANGRGNCLAISNLFVASARHLGLDARYKTMSVRPTWEQAGLTLIRYEHIVAIGELDSRDEYIVDFLPELTSTSRDSQLISDEQALALYYNNLGAEALVRRETELGVALILKSIKLWPEHSDSWNNIGAAYRRLGETRLAELSYKRALRHDGNNYSALANLTQFYIGEGRQAEAEQFVARVNRYYRKNPYYYYYLARLGYSSGDYESAREFLDQAIYLKRDDPELYRALADTYRRLGDDAKAEELVAFAATVKPRKTRYWGERKNWARSITIFR